MNEIMQKQPKKERSDVDISLSRHGFDFLGEFEIAIDSKNRVAIPAKWRDCVIAQNLIISYGFEGTLAVKTQQIFTNFLRDIDANDQFSKHVRNLKRRILGGSQEIILDKWFRFVIPSQMTKDKKIKDTVILIGMGDHFEIWTKEEFASWSNAEENSMEKAAEAISTIK